MSKLILGTVKTMFGNIDVMANEANQMIEKRIDQAVAFLATKGITAHSECGSDEKGGYFYNGHNLLSKCDNECDRVYFQKRNSYYENGILRHDWDAPSRLTVLFHKKYISYFTESYREWNSRP